MALDHRPHRSIQDEDALGEERVEASQAGRTAL
jgi:hypothetical protein